MTRTSTELYSNNQLVIFQSKKKKELEEKRAIAHISGCDILPCKISWKLGTRCRVLRARLSMKYRKAVGEKEGGKGKRGYLDVVAVAYLVVADRKLVGG